MCNIWQKKFDTQISPEELEVVLGNSLFKNIKFVGLNGGEPTLRNDLRKICEVCVDKLPKLKSVTLITNGLMPEKINEQIEKSGYLFNTHKINFCVMVSLDGVGKIHDIVRGRERAFENAIKLFSYLKHSPFVSSYQACCTVIKDNVYGLHDLLDWCISNNIYVKFRLAVEHRRLDNQKNVSNFSLTPEGKNHFVNFLKGVINFYEKEPRQKAFYRSLINQILFNKPRSVTCEWQYRGVTLSHKGDLLYCATKSNVLGNALVQDSEKMYFENSAILDDIISKDCNSCAHDYSGRPKGKLLLQYCFDMFQYRYGISLSKIKNSALMSPIKLLWYYLSFVRRKNKYYKTKTGLKPFFDDIWTSSNDRRIMICGWYGTETLGDKAILGGIVNIARQSLKKVSIYLISLNPHISELTKIQMLELKDVKILSIEEGLALTPKMSMIVFGGGPLMALDNLAEMIAVFKRASDAGIPTSIAGCGIGPLGSRYHNNAIREIIELADYRIYRDSNSIDCARRIGINTTKDVVAEDPAFTWLRSKKSDNIKSEDTGNKFKLLLGLRNWTYNEYAPELAREKASLIRKNFDQNIICALSKLSNTYRELQIIPFPMCTNCFGQDDRWYYRNLFRNSSLNSDALDYSALSKELSPDEAVNYFINADAILAMRYHSLVFAIALGKSVVAIDYTMGKGKVSALAETCGIPYCAIDKICYNFMISNLSRIINNIQEKTFSKKKINRLVFPRAFAEILDTL
jgi:polysaccharide pyruvyl transferase WcaK-like protein/MoaA/NifB/PqqE/SkfB family radical SAM enzyme